LRFPGINKGAKEEVRGDGDSGSISRRKRKRGGGKNGVPRTARKERSQKEHRGKKQGANQELEGLEKKGVGRKGNFEREQEKRSVRSVGFLNFWPFRGGEMKSTHSHHLKRRWRSRTGPFSAGLAEKGRNVSESCQAGQKRLSRGKGRKGYGRLLLGIEDQGSDQSTSILDGEEKNKCGKNSLKVALEGGSRR